MNILIFIIAICNIVNGVDDNENKCKIRNIIAKLTQLNKNLTFKRICNNRNQHLLKELKILKSNLEKVKNQPNQIAFSANNSRNIKIQIADFIAKLRLGYNRAKNTSLKGNVIVKKIDISEEMTVQNKNVIISKSGNKVNDAFIKLLEAIKTQGNSIKTYFPNGN